MNYIIETILDLLFPRRVPGLRSDHYAKRKSDLPWVYQKIVLGPWTGV